jgi:hypothetical protein
MSAAIWIGYDHREAAAFAVARHSMQRHMTQPIPVHGLVLGELQRNGLYTRPIEYRRSTVDRPVMWDVISDAPMSTEHACARFLVPHLAKSGLALFCDGDILFRGNVSRLFETLQPGFAVYCVKHRHVPSSSIKMDGQEQTRYARKNWSSFMVFDVDHPANRALTLEVVNSLPGRDLHRFCWLDDSEIGDLPPEWNFLVGHTDPSIEPKAVHFTDGVPDMPGYETTPYADEWRAELERWAA